MSKMAETVLSLGDLDELQCKYLTAARDASGQCQTQLGVAGWGLGHSDCQSDRSYSRKIIQYSTERDLRSQVNASDKKGWASTRQIQTIAESTPLDRSIAEFTLHAK